MPERPFRFQERREKDQYERFPASESLAYQNKFLDKPIIDIWAYKFRDILIEKFGDTHEDELLNKKRQFSYIQQRK